MTVVTQSNYPGIWTCVSGHRSIGGITNGEVGYAPIFLAPPAPSTAAIQKYWSVDTFWYRISVATTPISVQSLATLQRIPSGTGDILDTGSSAPLVTGSAFCISAAAGTPVSAENTTIYLPVREDLLDINRLQPGDLLVLTIANLESVGNFSRTTVQFGALLRSFVV